MSTAIASKKIVRKKDVVIIPRKEYEELLVFKKIKEFTPTPEQKKALAHAEHNFKLKKMLSYNERVQKLGFVHRS